MNFIYHVKAVGKGRKILDIYIPGSSANKIKLDLQKKGFYVQKVDLSISLTIAYVLGQEGFSESEIENFCYNLSELLETGLSEQEIFFELERCSNSKIVSSAIKLASYFISNEGLDLASALEKANFPEQLVSVIRVGAESSRTQEMLMEYLHFVKWQNEAKRKLRSAVMYPIFLIFVAYGFFLSQTFMVFPKLRELFQNTEGLPLMTRLMLYMSSYSDKGILGVLFAIFVFSIIFFGILFILIWISKKIFVGASPESFLGKLKPAVFIRSILAAFFLNSLRFAIRSGMPYQEALKAARRSILIEESSFTRRVDEAVDLARRGASLDTALKKIFENETYASFFLAGIAKKDIDTVLDRAVETMKRRVERQIEPVAAVVRYAALFIVAGIIATLLFSSYFPIYQQMIKTY